MEVAKHQLIVHQQQLKYGDLGQGKCTSYAGVHVCMHMFVRNWCKYIYIL